MPANAMHIPEILVVRIDAAMKVKGGYSNRVEFVREAIRLRCEEIEAEVLAKAEIENGQQTTTKKKRRRDLYP